MSTAELKAGRGITGESTLRTGTAGPDCEGTNLSRMRHKASSFKWIFRCYLTGKFKASTVFIFGGCEVLMRAWSRRSPNGLHNAKSSPSVLPGHFRPDLSQIIVLLVWGVKRSFAKALQSSSVFFLFSSSQGIAPTCKLLAAPQLQGILVLYHNMPVPRAHPQDAMNTGSKQKRKKEGNSNRRCKEFKTDKPILQFVPQEKIAHLGSGLSSQTRCFFVSKGLPHLLSVCFSVESRCARSHCHCVLLNFQI